LSGAYAPASEPRDFGAAGGRSGRSTTRRCGSSLLDALRRAPPNLQRGHRDRLLGEDAWRCAGRHSAARGRGPACGALVRERPRPATARLCFAGAARRAGYLRFRPLGAAARNAGFLEGPQAAWIGGRSELDTALAVALAARPGVRERVVSESNSTFFEDHHSLRRRRAGRRAAHGAAAGRLAAFPARLETGFRHRTAAGITI